MSWEMITKMPIHLWLSKQARQQWQTQLKRQRQSEQTEREAEAIERAKMVALGYGIEAIYQNPGMKLPAHVTPLQDAVRTLSRSGYLCLDRNGQILGLDDRYIAQVQANPVPKSELEAQFRRNRFRVISGTGQPCEPKPRRTESKHVSDWEPLNTWTTKHIE